MRRRRSSTRVQSVLKGLVHHLGAFQRRYLVHRPRAVPLVGMFELPHNPHQPPVRPPVNGAFTATWNCRCRGIKDEPGCAWVRRDNEKKEVEKIPDSVTTCPPAAWEKAGRPTFDGGRRRRKIPRMIHRLLGVEIKFARGVYIHCRKRTTSSDRLKVARAVHLLYGSASFRCHLSLFVYLSTPRA